MYLAASVGMAHPIFYLPQKHLWNLYKRHCSQEQGFSKTDSYLLFLALLHSTDQVAFSCPASCDPLSSETQRLIEGNIKQLVDVIQLTNTIQVPSFKQPSFVVSPDTSPLLQVPNWIEAWNTNIENFRSGARGQRLQESLQKTENRLSYFIRSGSPTSSYSQVVASWAAKAAGFPPPKTDRWMKIIRSCFDSAKIFSIPLLEIREVKGYCEENIPVGSVHFHTLMEVLKEGISRHTDYLGMNPVALGYTLLDVDTSVNEARVAEVLAQAPVEAPTYISHPDPVEYLKAKLAYLLNKHTAPEEQDTDHE